ncbi:bifunctional diguanylate cyclase/phosphodiesterase [Nitratiruptor sp. YY09-18]|uniref:putative bifunctional diguanylate cyclase/phosphodiesterase n=1 Tax=Nitratiruptor sp. YY09-18 TaxID=2724901 RepID=UPI001915E8D3|nr:bifunctional diguanylate cyclase/phosphodiesterase [Nitratiruptor sp. YY09-18]BCD67919.1 diguanylate cyclase/phosphodiesterase [Nitratiruptor sp. YY09-18]
MKKISSSLSKRILFYLSILSIALIISIFYAFEEAGKNAFKKMEEEKAQVIIDTILPSVAMNLYLGFDNKVKDIITNILKTNKNILGITIINHGKVVSSSIKRKIGSQNYFIFTREIKEPNAENSLGRMHVIYSYEHFNTLMDKYSKLLWQFLIGIILVMVLFGIYIDRLLNPLRRITNELLHYSPKKLFKFNLKDRDDEIGAIASALETMQERIVEYARNQENVNALLEQKVKEKTQELKNRLYIDSLTGLPNRFKLSDDIEKFDEIGLVVLNIDNFKEINDFFGHEIGDKILKDFAQKIHKLFKSGNPKFYRLSGDEFALLFSGKMSKSDIEHFLNIFAEKLEQMIFFHGDKELALHVTMGAALQKEGALEKADIALKKARQKRKLYEIYYDEDKEVEQQYKNNIEWIKKLKKSIELERVVPFFQPIVHVDTKRPKGYECLMRIIDDDGSMVSPVHFLDIAKKSRYYYKLTEIMIEKSCEYFENSRCSFSINLSILDILNTDIVQILKNALKKYSVKDRLILEIVESEGIENYDVIHVFLHEMKELGCQVAIDDFGTGYSNFEHILKLPIDYIKIDGSLIKNITTNKDAELIVSTIVDFAKKKHIKTVSEFVSSEEIYNKVKELGVDFAQGYYFSPPKQFVPKECISI